VVTGEAPGLSAPVVAPMVSMMDVSPYLEHQRALAEREDAAARARAADARERLPSLVELLVGRYGVTRVWLFGSLLEGVLHERSDIDVAVEGLAPVQYWDAGWRCDDVMGRPVDLVPVEDAPPSLIARIREEGELLHG